MNQLMKAFQLPKICCSCGETYGTKLRQIKVSRITDMGFYFVAASVKKENYSFNVPLCENCSDNLEEKDRLIKIVKFVSIVPFVAFGIYLTTQLNSFVFSIMIPLSLYGILNALFFQGGMNGYGLGGYTGRYFWFSNRKFFKQFAELNPNFVAPNHQQRPSPQLNKNSVVIEQLDADQSIQPPPAAANSVNPSKRPRFSMPDSNLWPLILLGGITLFCGCITCVGPIITSFIK